MLDISPLTNILACVYMVKSTSHLVEEIAFLCSQKHLKMEL